MFTSHKTFRGVYGINLCVPLWCMQFSARKINMNDLDFSRFRWWVGGICGGQVEVYLRRPEKGCWQIVVKFVHVYRIIYRFSNFIFRSLGHIVCEHDDQYQNRQMKEFGGVLERPYKGDWQNVVHVSIREHNMYMFIGLQIQYFHFYIFGSQWLDG